MFVACEERVAVRCVASRRASRHARTAICQGPRLPVVMQPDLNAVFHITSCLYVCRFFAPRSCAEVRATRSCGVSRPSTTNGMHAPKQIGAPCAAAKLRRGPRHAITRLVPSLYNTQMMECAHFETHSRVMPTFGGWPTP